ncbi:hypothetical protein K458DRAFT_84219 [Lentithecium fluviatile CBS 122367]|uniref:Uncharacterized protein n=1 Tax=Lentithecium fluviatile CBS 122367 TaxID=1168545 RepID=A0A6G1ISJ4_9PLEO|nr:hypothetical protein K458DRAFT_84219 [Lentithecium fluviatile CBS 122367]
MLSHTRAPAPEFSASPRLRTSPSRKPYRRTPYFPLPAASAGSLLTTSAPIPPIPSSTPMSPPAPRLEQNEFEPSPTLSSSAFSPTLSSATFSPTPSFDSVFSSPALSSSSSFSSPSSSPSMGSSGFPSPTPASVDWGMGLGLTMSPGSSPVLAPTVFEKSGGGGGGGRVRACADSTIHVCRLRLKGFEDMVMVAGEEARRSRVRAKAKREKRRRDEFEC